MKAFAFLSLVAALAIGGYLFVASNREPSGTTGRVEAAESSASAGVAAANLQSAATTLEASRAASGTYAGTSLDGLGVRLVRADAASYCVEAGTGAATTHLAGPGGRPSPGPC